MMTDILVRHLVAMLPRVMWHLHGWVCGGRAMVVVDVVVVCGIGRALDVVVVVVMRGVQLSLAVVSKVGWGQGGVHTFVGINNNGE